MAEKFDLFGLISGASFAAGIAVLVVAAARLILKKAPKRWSYIMWAVVFFRCLCPFSAESSVSIFNALNFAETAWTSENAEADITDDSPAVTVPETAPVTDGGYVPFAPSETVQPPASEEYIVNTESVRSDSDMPAKNNIQNVYNQYDIQNVQKTETEQSSQFEQSEQPAAENSTDSRTIFTIVWLCGVGAMALYGIVSAVRLAARVKTAVRTEKGIYESDRISTAFAAGLLRPKIYIPCGIPEDERRLIVMHERVHIRRRDYLFKLLAFAGLSLHWFNPLIWAAFALMTRDMEMSCDEAVLRECGESGRILYAEALLRVSVRGFGGAAVVGFGETGIKKRVKNVLNYKKPGKLAAVAAAVVMLASCTMAGTDAVTDNADSADSAGTSTTETDITDFAITHEITGWTMEDGEQLEQNQQGSETSSDIAVSREYEFDAEKYIDGLIYKDQWQLRSELDFLSDEQYDVFIRAWLFIDMIEPLNEISIRSTSETPVHFLDKNGEVCASYYDREKNEVAQYVYVSTYQSFYKYLQSVFTQDAVDEIMSDRRFLTVGDELYFIVGEAGGAIYFKGGEYRLVEKNDDEVVFEYIARQEKDEKEWTETHPIRLVRTEDGWHSELFEHLRSERRPEVYEHLRGEQLSEQDEELRVQEELRRFQEEEERLKKEEAELRRQSEEAANAEKFSYPFSQFPVSAADLGEYGANERHVLFAVPKGTAVLAAEDGTVKSAKRDFNIGYGLCMEISHDDEMSTFYAHLDEFAVKVGDKVKKGDVIAYSGSSGYTEGDALLFEIRKDGIYEDPRDYYSFSEDGYRRALEEIGKDYDGDGFWRELGEIGKDYEGDDWRALGEIGKDNDGGGIQGTYYENGQETVKIGGETYYLISTEEQLRAIAAGEYGMDKNFMQKSTIQLSSDEWIPIGTKDDPFTGSYNGNGFEIIGLTITDPYATRIGMFGWTENANIYNITLRDYDIESAGRNAKRISVAPIVPVVTNGTQCYDNHVYPAGSPESAAILIKPCPQEVKISSLYGKDNENSVFNKGINYMAAKGTEVYAAADGKVLVSEDQNNGYGMTIIIDHGGELATLYAHLDEVLVSKDDEVKAGDLIGYSGHTGFTYGDTLHFEVRENGQHVDPMNYFKI